jgi:hypothetical protein
MRMGLLFTTIKPEHRKLLNLWLNKLGGHALQGVSNSVQVGRPHGIGMSTDRELRAVVRRLIAALANSTTLDAYEAQSMLDMLSS